MVLHPPTNVPTVLLRWEHPEKPEVRTNKWGNLKVNKVGWKELGELKPQNSVRAKNWLSLMLETVFFETVFGPTNRAELKVTDLRWRSPICNFLRFSAKIFGFLRKSADFCGFLRPPNAWFSKRRGESAKICGFLRKSAFWALSVTLVPSLKLALNETQGNSRKIQDLAWAQAAINNVCTHNLLKLFLPELCLFKARSATDCTNNSDLRRRSLSASY